MSKIQIQWHIPGDGTDTAPDEEPIVADLLFTGTKTLLTGPPKEGKTYFSMPLCAAVCRGRPFLTLATEPTGVLYLTEEPRGTFERKLESFGMFGEDHFRYLRRTEPDVAKLTREEILGVVHEATKDFGAGLVVVDTLSRWAGLKEGQENDAGAIEAVVQLLDAITESGAAVLVLHHSPWVAQRARGSTHIHAAFDDLYHLEKDAESGARTLKPNGCRHEPSWQRLSYQLVKDPDEGTVGLQYTGDQKLYSAARTIEAVAAVRELGQLSTTMEVAAELGWTEKTTRKWLERALAHKLVASETKPPTSTTYWRPRLKFEYLREA